MKKVILVLSSVSVVLLSLIVLKLYVLSAKPSVIKYEYAIIAPRDENFEKEMNEYGQDGWSVVSARRASGAGDRMAYEMILQRQAKK